jgi:carbon starvation protein CstA
MRAFSILLLLLVGVVFVLGPAKLLENLTGMSTVTWVVIIFCYYFLATILPINQIIGRIYPFFGAVLLFMAVGLTAGLLTEGYDILPTLDFSNLHPKGLPLWPLMFITIACGAISGFHSTQSPMMARCMANERHGRTVFYGAMVGEGIIGLIWVTLGLSFYKGPEALSAALAAGGPAHVVNEVATTLLGGFGGILAIIGVVILPITTGDTAFRSARLIVADFMHISQSKAARRLAIAIPLFVIGIVVSRVDFNVLWRYFGWANQTLAALVLWAAAAWMIKRGKMHWIVTLPATFMTTVVSTYILYEKIGFNLPITVANYGGIACGLVAFAIFMAYFRNRRVADAPTA